MIITNDYKFSSNINEVIKAVFNLFFFMIRFRKHKKAPNRLQQTKIEKYAEKTSEGKKVTSLTICILCFYLIVFLYF